MDRGGVTQVEFTPVIHLYSWQTRYESIIATLCENLDSLDEPDARAAMIWIVGEYAERIDNADELLESFLEGFHDESTQVILCCASYLECFMQCMYGMDGKYYCSSQKIPHNENFSIWLK